MTDVKVPETKTKILNTARELFFTKGYEDTSVNDIIVKLGISKGAFYHHFKSKEDLLDEITFAMGDEVLKDMKKINAEPINAIEKLNKVFSFSRQFKTANKEFVRVYIDAIYRPSNLIFLDKMSRWSIKAVAPFLIEIINQGKKEGLFDIDDTEESVVIIWEIIFGMARVNSAYVLNKNATKEDKDALIRKNKAYERTIERILGSKPGSIKVIDIDFIDMFRDD